MKLENQRKLLNYINSFWDDMDEGNEYNTLEAATVLWDFMQDNTITEDDLLSIYNKVKNGVVDVVDRFDWDDDGFVGILVNDIKSDREKDTQFSNDATELIDFDSLKATEYLRKRVNEFTGGNTLTINLYNAIKELIQ